MAITDTDIAFLIHKRLKAATAMVALVANRIKPDTIDPEETLPAIRYEIVRSNPWHNVGGPPSESQSQMQIDCYGSTRLQANMVAEAVKDNLDGFSGALGTIFVSDCVLDNFYDRIDPPPPGGKTWRKRRTMDFLISHTTPTPTLS